LIDNSELAGFIVFVTILLIWHAYRSKTDADYQKLIQQIRTTEITGETPDEWLVKVKEQPEFSRSKIAKNRNGLVINTSRLGLKQVTGDNDKPVGRMFFGLIIVLGLMIFINGIITFGTVPSSTGCETALDYCEVELVGIRSIIIGLMMFLPVTLNSIKSASIVVNNGELSITYRGFLRTTKRKWGVDEIEGVWMGEWPQSIWRAKKGLHIPQKYVNPMIEKISKFPRIIQMIANIFDDDDESDISVDCLYVKPIKGRPFILLVGWSAIELLWIRHEIRKALKLGDADMNDEDLERIPTSNQIWNMRLKDILFSFQGRINRQRWWLLWISVGVVSFVYSMVVGNIAAEIMPSDFLWSLAVSIAMLPAYYVYIAIDIKRLHDTGRSWGWGWLSVVSCVFSVIFLFTEIGSDAEMVTFLGKFIIPIPVYIICGFFRGEDGDNEYGPDPLVKQENCPQDS